VIGCISELRYLPQEFIARPKTRIKILFEFLVELAYPFCSGFCLERAQTWHSKPDLEGWLVSPPNKRFIDGLKARPLRETLVEATEIAKFLAELATLFDLYIYPPNVVDGRCVFFLFFTSPCQGREFLSECDATADSGNRSQ
jgi:hypothetical protein